MNILIIGLGSIAKKHINALNQISSEFKIYALRSNRKSRQYQNVENIFTYRQAEGLDIDFVIISSPTSKHLDDIRVLLDYNIPLFIEKPLAHKLEVQDILEKVKEKKIKTYVACNLRFLESLIYLKENILINKNLIINEVNAYCGSYLPDWRQGENFKYIYSANKELGGGVHLDLIHEIDYLYWMFGIPLKVHKLLKSNSSLNINSVDYANYNLEYTNFVANVVLNYFRHDVKRYLEVVFDQFTIKVNILENKVYKNDQLIFTSNQKILDTYKTQLQYFINNISLSSFNDIHEAYEVLKICL